MVNDPLTICHGPGHRSDRSFTIKSFATGTQASLPSTGGVVRCSPIRSPLDFTSVKQQRRATLPTLSTEAIRTRHKRSLTIGARCSSSRSTATQQSASLGSARLTGFSTRCTSSGWIRSRRSPGASGHRWRRLLDRFAVLPHRASPIRRHRTGDNDVRSSRRRSAQVLRCGRRRTVQHRSETPAHSWHLLVAGNNDTVVRYPLALTTQPFAVSRHELAYDAQRTLPNESMVANALPTNSLAARTSSEVGQRIVDHSERRIEGVLRCYGETVRVSRGAVEEG